MRFSTQSSSCRASISRVSTIIAFIFLSHTAVALQTTTAGDATSSLRNPLGDRNLDRLSEAYNVNTHFKLQLDYVPSPMDFQEEDRLALLLEECLLDNVPPFQEKVDSAQYHLKNVNVVFGEQKVIAEIASVGFRSQYTDYEPYNEENEETFRLIVDVSVEGEYQCSENVGNSDHPMIPPTNKDFDYALLRFFDVDEGGFTFLDSYVTKPESTLPYFAHLRRIHATKEQDTSDPHLTTIASSTSRTKVNPLVFFAAGMMVFVGAALYSARRYYATKDRNGFSLFTASQKECGTHSSTSESEDDSSTETIVYSVEGEESEEAVKYRCSPPPEILPSGDVDIDATYEMSKILANGYQMIS